MPSQISFSANHYWEPLLAGHLNSTFIELLEHPSHMPQQIVVHLLVFFPKGTCKNIDWPVLQVAVPLHIAPQLSQIPTNCFFGRLQIGW